MEIFLAKVIGLYFFIVGIIVVARQKSLMPAISELVKNKGLLIVLAAIELVAGLALVVLYPIEFSVNGLFALIGYMMVIEGIIYFAAPVKTVQKFIGRFNRPAWYTWGGILSILVGLYLIAIGFGFWV